MNDKSERLYLDKLLGIHASTPTALCITSRFNYYGHHTPFPLSLCWFAFCTYSLRHILAQMHTRTHKYINMKTTTKIIVRPLVALTPPPIGWNSSSCNVRLVNAIVNEPHWMFNLLLLLLLLVVGCLPVLYSVGGWCVLLLSFGVLNRRISSACMQFFDWIAEISVCNLSSMLVNFLIPRALKWLVVVIKRKSSSNRSCCFSKGWHFIVYACRCICHQLSALYIACTWAIYFLLICSTTSQAPLLCTWA